MATWPSIHFALHTSWTFNGDYEALTQPLCTVHSPSCSWMDSCPNRIFLSGSRRLDAQRSAHCTLSLTSLAKIWGAWRRWDGLVGFVNSSRSQGTGMRLSVSHTWDHLSRLSLNTSISAMLHASVSRVSNSFRKSNFLDSCSVSL